MANLTWQGRLQKAYEIFANRFPVFKRLTYLIPDSIYKEDPRYKFEQEKCRQKSSALEDATTKLTEINESLKKTQRELSEARRELRKYLGIEERLEAYEQLAEDMRLVIQENRKKIGEEAAKATIYHEAEESYFGIALNAYGSVVGASRKAVKLLGYKSEREILGDRFYGLIQDGEKIRQTLNDLAFSDTKTVRFSLHAKNNKKIGDVLARLFYGFDSSSRQELVAVSIVEEKAHIRLRRKEARERLKEMRSKKNFRMEQGNATGDVDPLPA